MQKNNTAVQAGKLNKLADWPIRTLILSMGMPMVLSMVLQAVYNIVDTIFVSHMENGATAVLALTDSYSIQLLIVAVGVGTGIGINALLSKTLGERNFEKASCIAGNGIFLAVCIYAVFLLFGIFGTRAFIGMQANGNALRQEMGEQYLRICCIGSFGSIGYTVYERFLQGTGRTNLSTIAQITGALLNIILDPIFIFGLDMGVTGAAAATVVGQLASLGMAMLFHYRWDKEIRRDWKHIRPQWGLIRGIYAIGIPAAIMQGLLSVMVLFVNLVFGTQGDMAEPLQAAYGIYYKIQQFALFAAFGLSNTLIIVVAFHYGRRERARLRQCVRYGLLYAAGLMLLVTLLFQIFASPIAGLFQSGDSPEIHQLCMRSMRICTLGYVFMGVTVLIQGILQGFRCVFSPLVLALLRLLVLPIPFCLLFLAGSHGAEQVWWAFPLAECITAVISVPILLRTFRKKTQPANKTSFAA